MKVDWAVLRICLALIAIFAMGVLVGRLTDTPEAEAVTLDGGAKLDRVSRRVFRRYQELLEFTDEQRLTLQERFVAVSLRMRILPRRSRARLVVLEDFHQEIAPFLTEVQREKADAILEDARALDRVD